MKMEYNVVKTMVGDNPDGKLVIISEGDKVRIKFDDTVELSNDGKRAWPDNIITCKIFELKKTVIECQDLLNPGFYLKLKPRQIIWIKDI